MEVPSPAGLGVGDVNFPRTRLLCDGCPPLGWVGWILVLRVVPRMGLHVPFALTLLAYVYPFFVSFLVYVFILSL